MKEYIKVSLTTLIIGLFLLWASFFGYVIDNSNKDRASTHWTEISWVVGPLFIFMVAFPTLLALLLFRIWIKDNNE